MPMKHSSGHMPAWAEPASGQWVAPGDGQSGGLLADPDRINLIPFWLPKSVPIDRIAIHVSSAGTTGAVYRLGAYRANSDHHDFQLVFDSGTVDATTTGNKILTVSETLPSGLVWLAAAEQGGATTRPQCHRIVNDRNIWITDTVFLTGTFRGMDTANSHTGAFPDTFAFGVSPVQLPPNVQVRVA